MEILAALILLLRPDVTPEQAIEAAQQALERVGAGTGRTAPRRGKRRTESELEARVLGVVASFPHYPSKVEVLAKVKGGRSRMLKIINSMISKGILEHTGTGRESCIKVKS